MLSNKFEEINAGDLIEGVDGPVNRAAINRYAETSGDRNPIHTTYGVAMAAGLKGVIQHGLFSLGWLIKTLTNWTSDNGKLKHLNIQFRAMVRPNDIVYSKGTIIKKYQENDQNFVELEVVQEAWSLLCKGTAQSTDKTIDPEQFKTLLSNAKFRIDTQMNLDNGEIQALAQNNLEFQAEGLEIIPNTLSFWEALIRGWPRKGEKIELKLTSPLKDGMAEFEIHRASRSIQGTAIILLSS